TRFASKVYIIHRREGFRASKIMLEKAENNPKIEFLTNTIVTDALGEDALTAVKLQNTQTGAESELPLDGLFIAIGHTPNTQLFANQIEVDEKGYILTSQDKSHVTATNIPGVFACGDVQDKRYRQAITAAGSGCSAALDAEHYLESLPELEEVSEPVAA
ncbi:MAG: FAD-dependent oxidoreductase, partial [Anaerolineae bacterium]|nr:FAD-dependent oxidoreductase [Anaerolineae bacterium]